MCLLNAEKQRLSRVILKEVIRPFCDFVRLLIDKLLTAMDVISS